MASQSAWRRDRQREAEQRAAARTMTSPQQSAVGLDQLAADRQPDAEPARLGGVEGLEDPLQIALGDAGAAVGHLDLDLVALSRPIATVDLAARPPARRQLDRLHRIAQQVEDHLLQVDLVDHHHRQPAGRREHDADAAQIAIHLDHADAFLRRPARMSIGLGSSSWRCAMLRMRCHHVAGAGGLADDLVEQVDHPRQVGLRLAGAPARRQRVVLDRAERLGDLVRQRHRHLARGVHPHQVRQAFAPVGGLDLGGLLAALGRLARMQAAEDLGQQAHAGRQRRRAIRFRRAGWRSTARRRRGRPPRSAPPAASARRVACSAARSTRGLGRQARPRRATRTTTPAATRALIQGSSRCCDRRPRGAGSPRHANAASSRSGLRRRGRHSATCSAAMNSPISAQAAAIAWFSSPGRASTSEARMALARRSKPMALSSSSCARLRASALPKTSASSRMRPSRSSGQARSSRMQPKLRPPMQLAAHHDRHRDVRLEADGCERSAWSIAASGGRSSRRLEHDRLVGQALARVQGAWRAPAAAAAPDRRRRPRRSASPRMLPGQREDPGQRRAVDVQRRDDARQAVLDRPVDVRAAAGR